MSEPHKNSDTAPRGLRNALAIVRASAKKSIKLRRSGYARAPRSVCKICAAVWDYAIIDPKSLPQASICADCKGKLTEGYTALRTANPDAYAFVMSYQLKEDGLAGKIVKMSPENFAEIKRKFNESKPVAPPEA